VITPVKIPVRFTVQTPQPLFCRTLPPPDALDIIVTKDLITPVYRTTFPHSSDHLPVLIYTRRQSSFLNLPDRFDFKRTDWALQGLPGGWTSIQPRPTGQGGSDTVEELSSAISKAESTSKSHPRDDPQPWTPACIQDEICQKNCLRRHWQVIRAPL
jgi:hypothetical protein